MTVPVVAPKTDATQRVVRTFVQVLVAFALAVPAVVGALGLPADKSAKVVGLASVIVILVTALHNALESAGVLPQWFKTLPSVPNVTGTVAGDQAAAAKVAPALVDAAKKAEDVSKAVAAAQQAAKALQTGTAGSGAAAAATSGNPHAAAAVQAPLVTPSTTSAPGQDGHSITTTVNGQPTQPPTTK